MRHGSGRSSIHQRGFSESCTSTACVNLAALVISFEASHSIKVATVKEAVREDAAMAPSVALPVTLSCICGACELRADAQPISIYACHCLTCQRTSGTDYQHSARFATGQVGSAVRQAGREGLQVLLYRSARNCMLMLSHFAAHHRQRQGPHRERAASGIAGAAPLL